MTLVKYSKNDKYDTFIYVSVEESVIEKEIYDLCDRIFDSKITYSRNNKDQIEQVVKYIYTIFRDYKITKMIVHVKSKNEYTSVTTKNNSVEKFTKKINTDLGQLEFEYNQNCINFIYGNFKELTDNEKINSFINNSINTVRDINNATKIELSDKEKTLISMYKDFFGHYPDFSKKEEYLQVQPMMWLICQKNDLNLELGDYTIRYNGKPKSTNLQKILDNIVPYGKTDESICNSINNEQISNMGQIVNNYIDHYKDKQEILDNIALVSYVKDRIVSKYYDIYDIVNASKDQINDEQVEEILEFLSDLDKSLQSQKVKIKNKQ